MVINPIVGVYIPIIRIPIKGGMTIPYIAMFALKALEEKLAKSSKKAQASRGETDVFSHT